MPLIPFLSLIRYRNLLMIILTQVLIKYMLLEPFAPATFLGPFDFSLLVLSMVSLAAAGNIINDLNDIVADRVNKPGRNPVGTRISERAAFYCFLGLNLLGVGIGFYLSNLVGRPSFTALFILPSAFLYLYATQIKSTVLVGNLVISVMVAMIVVIVGIFDLLPVITPQNKSSQGVIFSILIDYAAFAFLINFLREVVKDQEDINGDHKAGYRTLPLVLGRQRTNALLFFAVLLPILGVVFYIYRYLHENEIAVIYVLLVVLAPLLYFLLKIWNTSTRAEYKHLSLVLKMVLVAGLFSIGLYRFILI